MAIKGRSDLLSGEFYRLGTEAQDRMSAMRMNVTKWLLLRSDLHERMRINLAGAIAEKVVWRTPPVQLSVAQARKMVVVIRTFSLFGA